MASISSLSGGSSSSSIYGSRNVLSGLASGLDTESMIENAISGYQTKLSSLQQSKTKVEWKQEAYRSMITKLVGFSQKYTSYTSGTNLLSSSFFDNAVKVTALGGNASKVSATGRTSSDIKVNSVEQLATATTYKIDANTLENKLSANDTATKYTNISGNMYVGALDGSMTLTYGNKSVAISFDENDVLANAEEMAEAINKKLEDEMIAFDSGAQEKASDRIKAVASEDGSSVSFELVKEGDSNTVKISRVSGNLGGKLGISTTIDKDDTVTDFDFRVDAVREKKSVIEALNEKGFSITYNGTSKTVYGPSEEEVQAAAGDTDAKKYENALQAKIDKAFGEGKLTVSNDYTGSSTTHFTFRFNVVDEEDSFSVTTPLADKLGMEGGLSNKLNTERKLSDVLVDSAWGEGTKNADGEMEYTFRINKDSSIQVTKDMTIKELMSKLNSSADSAVSVSYSEFTGKFVFSAKETGEGQEIEFSGLSAALFGDTTGQCTEGQNAKFNVTVNGETRTVERSSNSIDIDGLQITLKEEFTSGDAVTFSVASDADKIVDAIKSMVEDYNTMMAEIKEAYSTIPLKNSKGNEYMPLTDEDQAEMSESAVANYEKKAKTGLLFGDRDLSNLYSNMTEALRAFGVTGNDGTGIGITTTYSNGSTTLVVDENALRSALENNPDKVKEVFVGKNGNDGVMQKMKNQLDSYAGTTGASKGILINKAGSTLAPTSVYQNTLQKEIDSLEDEIENWQDKISDKIDYYNKKFTTLEKLIAQMNNQSSMLMGLSGGY